MSDTLQVSYDSLPYHSQYLTMTHPGRMAAMARLHGLEPPAVAGCRVLELGCSNGINLLAMSQSVPGGRFVGVDLSPRQVDEGREVAEALGASNVALRALDLLKVDDAFGTFDYIICHGVYSWVPPPVRDHILRICARNLAPDGVAYVSYNTYPGWHLRGMVREMLLFHLESQGVTDPHQRVRHARAFLKFLNESAQPPDGVYAHMLQSEATLLNEEDDSYLLHEHLDEVNHPVYFREFAAHAASFGLDYLSPARFSTRDAELPTRTLELLDRLASDRVGREQYLDLVRNRTFRQSLLCQAGRAPGDGPTTGRLQGLRLVAWAQPKALEPDIRSDATETFAAPSGESLTTNRPLVKAALALLYDLWPRSTTAAGLWEVVRARLGPIEDGPEALDKVLLRCIRANLIEVRVDEPAIATEPGARPKGAPVARYQADGGTRVISLRDRNVELETFDALTLRLLDGTRDRTALLDRLAEWVADGTFEIQDRAGQPLRDCEQVRAVLGEALEPSLRRLARHALLCE